VARAKSTLQPRRLLDKPRAPGRPQPGRGPTAGATTNEPIVLDDLPDVVPVTGPELEAKPISAPSSTGYWRASRLQAPGSPFSTATPGSPSGPPVLDRD
jgi:hypothetical protein